MGIRDRVKSKVTHRIKVIEKLLLLNTTGGPEDELDRETIKELITELESLQYQGGFI